jgi:hypothetical protein
MNQVKVQQGMTLKVLRGELADLIKDLMTFSATTSDGVMYRVGAIGINACDEDAMCNTFIVRVEWAIPGG